MNQQKLNHYFRNIWKPNIDQYVYTGRVLAEKVANDEWVLDVGCGSNPFKKSIKNLIGIDPATDQADIKTTIEDFKTDQRFDVAFCLGSINFGTEEIIVEQIRCLTKLLKPQARIYWRCNPGLQDHNNNECKNIDFFPWSIEKHVVFSELFGFKLLTFKWDNFNRIYAEWVRS